MKENKQGTQPSRTEMVRTQSNVIYAQYAFKKHNNTTNIVKICTGIVNDTEHMEPIPSSLIEYFFSLECNAVNKVQDKKKIMTNAIIHCYNKIGTFNHSLSDVRNIIMEYYMKTILSKMTTFENIL